MRLLDTVGASYDAPENTLAAFKLSYAQGADATELDVHVTKDQELAVIHDADLKRTGLTEGKIAEMTLAEIQKIEVGRFGAWRERDFHEHVPVLSEVLPLIPAGKRLFIEIKTGPEAIEPLAKVLAAAKQTPDQLPIITFNFDVAVQAKQRFPKHQVLFLHSWGKDKTTGKYPEVDHLIDRAKKAGLDGLDLNYQFPIDQAFVHKVHSAGLKLYTWTIDDAVVARAEVEAGVDGITTNRPEWLRQQLVQKP